MEHKFKQLKDSLTPDQFDDMEYLENYAQKIENDDLWLANRIRARITNVTIDRKFNDIKKNLSAEEWNSLDFLEKLKTKYLSEPLIVKKIDNRIELLTKVMPASSAGDAPDKNTSATKALGKQVQPNDDSESKPAAAETKDRIFSYLKQHTFVALVLIPSLLFSFYQLFIATERFESQAKVLVQQPDASSTLDASMALLSGLGVSSNGNADPEILKTYINSIDMANFLDQKLNLKAHYQNDDVDIFSRLKDDDQEAFIDFYQKHINVVVDSASGIITISAQGFTPTFANQLVQSIANQAEWYINSIGHQLAKSQLAFITEEYDNIELRLQKAQTQLLNFQQKYNLLDPTSEGAALQQIAYGLEGQITAKETELKNLEHIMNSSSSRILSLKHELASLKQQLVNERQKLAQGINDDRSIGDILAEFTDLKVQMELALQAYTASQISLEKSRIEAYRQLKYLITVEAATMPEENRYPDQPYNISLFLILLSMIYGIGKIVISTIKELS
jgi:capsular polysaccharide transport system permease protein